MASSYNELMGLGSHSKSNLPSWYPLQDNAANTVVADAGTNADNGVLQGANTSARSVTGPNSWLSRALSFDGATHYIDSFANPFTGTGAFTLFARVKTSSTASKSVMSWGDNTVAGRQVAFHIENGVVWSRNTFNTASGGSGVNDNNWHNVCIRKPSGGGVSGITIRVDKSNKSVTTSGSDTINIQSLLSPQLAGNAASSTFRFSGSLCDLVAATSQWSDGDVDQCEDGPEPVNTVAPVLSGTETEGQILGCTSGTWGLASPFSGGSNGTVTYSYQWTRSNDGSGSGEANIGGATSSTYTLQAGDVGKYLRCYVRASNDGGYDVAADTPSAFTGAIAGSGGGATNSGQLLLLGCGA